MERISLDSPLDSLEMALRMGFGRGAVARRVWGPGHGGCKPTWAVECAGGSAGSKGSKGRWGSSWVNCTSHWPRQEGSQVHFSHLSLFSSSGCPAGSRRASDHPPQVPPPVRERLPLGPQRSSWQQDEGRWPPWRQWPDSAVAQLPRTTGAPCIAGVHSCCPLARWHQLPSFPDCLRRHSPLWHSPTPKTRLG